MLRLLLDEHVAPAVGAGLRRRNKGLLVHAMTEWQAGEFLGRDDVACLLEAERQGLTLVTYDRRTIPLLLKRWAEEGRSQGGVIFVDEKSIAPSDVGGLVRALAALIREAGDWEWANRICFLKR